LNRDINLNFQEIANVYFVPQEITKLHDSLIDIVAISLLVIREHIWRMSRAIKLIAWYFAN